MTIIDYAIFAFYMAGVLGIGVYYFLRNTSAEDYYVGSRSIKAHHVGMSVVATDVGGGFSIGLGGVGFAMGLAGSWLLFTGLVGAWLAAVLIVPRLKRLDEQHGLMTFPDFLRHRYNGNVALTASLVSGIGYLGFTSAQLLAGAKLASATILPDNPVGMDPILFALLVIAVVTIVYTTIGGLKAVIYTDTVQWAILLFGLIFVTIPVTLYEIGGFSTLWQTLPKTHFSLLNISPATFINWMITVIPIWFIAMTLYQRVFACRSVREAQKAWYIAGLLEYPVMAFTGVFLGMCARVVFPGAEAEMALPMLIRDILPVGVTGIVIASYFSAIMSTADSCLMASSGNFVGDIGRRYFFPNISDRTEIRLSMAATMILGIAAVALAAQFTTVLGAILHAYAFMVSGLFIPTLGAYFWRRGSSAGAIAGMLGGGLVTILLMAGVIELPESFSKYGFDQLDATFFGILASTFLYVAGSLCLPDRDTAREQHEGDAMEMPNTFDVVENLQDATLQHGPYNDRIYLMKLHKSCDTTKTAALAAKLLKMAEKHGYGKIFAKVRKRQAAAFADLGFAEEGRIPGFYRAEDTAVFLGYFLDEKRQNEADSKTLQQIVETAERRRPKNNDPRIDTTEKIVRMEPQHVEEMAEIYRQVFPTYPFPIHQPEYILKTMRSHVTYFGIEREGRIVSLSSAEMDHDAKNVEMTDFATLPEHRGSGFATQLLSEMETHVRQEGICTAYTIARAASFGMNIAFAKNGYQFAGRLVNNTNISGRIESMNLWHKSLQHG